MVATLGTSIFDNDITEPLGHQFVTFDLRQAVPGVGVFRGYKIEHLYDVGLFQIAAGTFIQFRFGIADDQRFHFFFWSVGSLQDPVQAIGAGLHTAAGTVHSYIFVQQAFFRHAQELSSQHTEYGTGLIFKGGCEGEDVPGFFFTHKSGSAVGALAGVDEVPVLVVLAGFTVSHTHHHDHQQGQYTQTDQHAKETLGESEDRTKAIPDRE